MSDAHLFVLALAVLLSISLGYCVRSLEGTGKEGSEWLMILALLTFFGSAVMAAAALIRILIPLL